jgi:hypothetical protein
MSGSADRERRRLWRSLPAWAGQLVRFARRNFRDISFEMVELLCVNSLLRESFLNNDLLQDILDERNRGRVAMSARRNALRARVK